MAKSDKLAALVVELRADNAQLRADFNKAAQSANNFQRQINGQLSGMRRQFKKTGDGFSTIFKSAAIIAAVKQVGDFALDIAKAADKVSLLSARIQAFSNDARGFEKAFAAAQQLGVAIEDAGAGIARFLVVGKDLGITTNEAQKLFTTFTQLARVGGASGAESSAAFIQLTQALGAGVLRGQELNSILEQAPLVAQAIAKELGVSVGQLKTLGEQGKISAEVVRSALVNAATEAGIQFEKLPETLEQQQTKLTNAWTVLLANLDKKLKTSEIFRFFNQRLTEAIQNAANRLSDDPQTRLNQRIADIRGEIGRIAILPGPRSSDTQQRLEALSAELAKLVPLAERYQQAVEATERADAPKAAGTASDPMAGLADVAVSSAKIGTTAMQQLFADFDSRTRTSLENAVQEYNQFVVELEELLARGVDAGGISIETYNARLQEFFDRNLQEVEVSSKKMKVEVEQSVNEFEKFAEQAAANIQTAFANFLFDPFKGGLKGMLAGFIDTIRRMVAEVAAAEILKMLFGGLAGSGNSFLASIGKAFGGGRAIGGQVLGNQAYLVGEKGPELLVGAAGKIVPGTDLGGGGMLTVAPVYNIDARGATQDLIKQLPAILSEHAKQTVQLARAVINDDISRGALGRA